MSYDRNPPTPNSAAMGRQRATERAAASRWGHAPRRGGCRRGNNREAALMGAEIAIADAESLPARSEGGRPSLYDPAYCDQVIEFCATGSSLTAFAASIGVSRRAIGRWIAAHDDFAEAADVAKAKAAAWWEGIAKDIAQGKGGPGASAVCTRALNNFAGEDWTETQKHDHSGRVEHVLMTRDQALEEAHRRGLPARVYDQ